MQLPWTGSAPPAIAAARHFEAARVLRNGLRSSCLGFCATTEMTSSMTSAHV
jgi:hypothetical protein